jgi:hypothetical protein
VAVSGPLLAAVGLFKYYPLIYNTCCKKKYTMKRKIAYIDKPFNFYFKIENSDFISNMALFKERFLKYIQ